MSLFKPLCKFTATVTSVRDIAQTLRKAIQVAQSDTPGESKTAYRQTVRRRLTIFPSRSDLFLTGPVFVEFPIDVLYSYQLVQREVGVKSGGGFVQKIINMQVNYLPSALVKRIRAKIDDELDCAQSVCDVTCDIDVKSLDSHSKPVCHVLQNRI